MGLFNVPYLAHPAQNVPTNQRTNLFPKYLLYTGCLIILVAMVIAFWVRAASNPFALPVLLGIRVDDHPKIATYIWTIFGSLLAYITLYLLDKLLHLMVKQKIQTSTSLAKIQGWSKLSYHKLFMDSKSPYLTLFSAATWITATLLTSGYTTLLTPKHIIQTIDLFGHEVDVLSGTFPQWSKDHFEDLTTCGWWNYTNPEMGHKVFYPSCPWAIDQVAFATSGMVSALNAVLKRNFGFTYSTYTRVADSVFNGSTGGVLPIGYIGIWAFMDDVDYSWVSDDLGYLSYNYSLVQQGFSADILCERTSDSPISRSEPDPVNVTNGYDDQQMSMYTFTYDTTGCSNPYSYNDTFVAPVTESMGVYVCMGDDITANKWTMYLRPFDLYTRTFTQNLTCTIDPYVTSNNVMYTSSGALIEQEIIEKTGSSSHVPDTLLYGLRSAMIAPYSSTSNAFIDAVISVSETAGSLNIDASDIVPILEDALRGVFEYQGTMSRIRYRALGAQLSDSITGNFTAWRLGWSGSAASIATILPLLAFVLGSAAWYCLEGLRAETRDATAWDPLDPVCLVAAGAAGGAAGRLGLLQGKGGADITVKVVRRYKVRFAGDTGLVADYWGDGGAGGKVAADGGVEYQAVAPEKDELMGAHGYAQRM